MTENELIAHGFTDADFAEMLMVTFGEFWQPTTAGPCAERRLLFERLMREMG